MPTDGQLPRDVDQIVDDYVSYLAKIADAVGTTFPQLAELSFTEAIARVHPGVQFIETPNGRGYYVVDEYWAAFLGGAAQELPEAFTLVRDIIACNVFEGMPLPYHLRTIGCDLLHERFPKAVRKGARDTRGFGHRWLIYEGAIYLREVEGLNLTRNEASPEQSACDVMAEVATRLGVPVKYATIRDWCTAQKFADFRARSLSLSNFFKDIFLQKHGVLKRPFLFSPFAELGRMRKGR